MPGRTKQTLERFAPFAGLCLFGGALWLMYHELRGFQYHDVLAYFHALPIGLAALALVLTGLNYVVLTGYDTLALRYLGQPLPYRNIALASFIGYSFSIALGHSYLTGGTVRYRLYTAWGLSGTDVARIILFCGMAFWAGYGSLGGIVFLLHPFVMPSTLHLPFPLWVLGIILLLLVGAYLCLSMFRRKPLQIRTWRLEVPSFAMALAQATLAITDLMLAAVVLYVLLPHTPEVPYLHLLAMYLLAVVAGLLSQVPGGMGVFDGILLTLLTPTLPAASVLGALVAYRGIYYLLPLVIAAVLLSLTEAYRRREQVERVRRHAALWLPRIVPPALAVVTFMAGALLLFSGALPSSGTRMEWLADFVPLPLVELSHFAGSLAGVGLLFLARGIQHRLNVAYGLTLATLTAGIVASILKGADYEAALFLTVVVLTLLPCRSYFYRQSALLAQALTPGFLAAIIAVLLSTVWLGLFTYRHVVYDSELWWRFAFDADAPRSLRGLVGAFGTVLVVGLLRLLRPASPAPTAPTETDLSRAQAILAASPHAEANLALLGDKRLLFNDAGTAFIMYAVEGRSWIAMGNPVGPEEEHEELAWRFRALADRHGGRVVFYEVTEDRLPLYLDLGLTLFKLGEDAHVNLETFSLEGSARKDQRRTLRKLEKEACTFEVLSATVVLPIMPALKAISDAWLAKKNMREKRFSLGFFDEAYLKHFPVAVVRRGEQIVAFANLWTTYDKEELSIDLMRYAPDAPSDVMEYLFTKLMLWGQAQGYRWFSLGMAPFSGMEDHALAPFWNRLGALIYRHGEQFYNFQGLRQYKDKFDPEWAPRYLAVPGGTALPGIVKDLFTLISGGVTGAFSKQIPGSPGS